MNAQTRTAAQVADYLHISEDRVYDLSDAIEDVIEEDRTATWTPSRMARRVKASTGEAANVMDWMVENLYLDKNERGAWSHYFALSGERRSRKLYA